MGKKMGVVRKWKNGEKGEVKILCLENWRFVLFVRVVNFWSGWFGKAAL